MEQKLQQRLVGIFVLAAFVLLIAPVLLDAEGRIPEKITNIPPQPKRPDLSHIRTVEPEEDLVEELPSSGEIEFVIEANNEAAIIADDNPQIAAIEMWSVQVASFRDAKKATAFRDQLRTQGYEVYVREKLLSDGSLFTQVFAGPVKEKSEANDLKSKIKTDVGEQGLVVRYRAE